MPTGTKSDGDDHTACQALSLGYTAPADPIFEKVQNSEPVAAHPSPGSRN